MRCSYLIPRLNQRCDLRLSRSGRGRAELSLAPVPQEGRKRDREITYDRGVFLNARGDEVNTKRRDDGWLLKLDGAVYYEIPEDLVRGR